MEIKKCSSYLNCNAPLCPLNLIDCEWYPDEQICSRFNYNWIKQQKKIFKMARNRERYFTLRMLKQNCIIKRAIKGIDPDGNEEQQIETWIKTHPPKRKLSENEREKKRELIRQLSKV